MPPRRNLDVHLAFRVEITHPQILRFDECSTGGCGFAEKADRELVNHDTGEPYGMETALSNLLKSGDRSQDSKVCQTGLTWISALELSRLTDF
jgi:hypothetical protein